MKNVNERHSFPFEKDSKIKKSEFCHLLHVYKSNFAHSLFLIFIANLIIKQKIILKVKVHELERS
jgi:hypothetical protein